MSFGAAAAVLFLLALNAAFVAAEFALVRVRREELQDAVTGGARGAGAALKALDTLDDSLAACQLGITMTSIGIGFLGEAALAEAIEPVLAGPLGHGAAVVVGLLISYMLITAVHITAGEQVPKLYALARPVPTSRWLAAPLMALSRIVRPAVWALSGTTTLMLRALGVRSASAHADEELPSSAELDALIARAHLAGRLEPTEAEMLSGVIDLHELSATQVMTPIFDVTAVCQDDTVLRALSVARDAGHSRLVVRERENGPATGMLHVADLAWELAQRGPETAVVSCVRDLLVVPESKPLDELLEEMKRQHKSLALVADEYGKPAGVVTVEDIVEEIVGEIADETDADAEAGALAPRPDGSWLLAGHVGLHELRDGGLPDWTDEHHNTLAGLVFSQLGRLPEVGDEVSRDGHRLVVVAMDEHRISQVRVFADAAPTDA